MGDYAIQARFEVECRPGDLMRWLSSTDGIAGWWSDTVTGSAASTGDVFQVRFPTSDVLFELEVAESGDGVVAWHVAESPPWWMGTTIRFEVGESEEAGASLLFTHAGFDSDDPIVAVVTPAWIRFLDNLVEVAQTGTPSPAVIN